MAREAAGSLTTTARQAILMIDDDDTLRESPPEQMVLHEDFEVLQADTATLGLQRAGEQHFDAIILDVGLPERDGRDADRVLRRNGIS